jgi:metal-responsive CopG/Arc/MetJ family transcriptional regulator
MVDLPDNQLKDLARISKAKKRPRASIIREAITTYIARNEPRNAIRKAFGLWGDHKVDGLEYQRKLRDEW